MPNVATLPCPPNIRAPRRVASEASSDRASSARLSEPRSRYSERSGRAYERVYERRRATRVARGTWGARYVPAAPARARLAEFLEVYRVSLATAAELSGSGAATLSALHYAQHPRFSEWVHITTQSAVFGMRFDLDQFAAEALVTSVGTARRLEALAVLGWSWPLLERGLGLPRQTLMFRRARPRVRAEYARQVRDLYDELSMRRGPSAHAARRAAAKGWLPPLAWDDEDLEDPRVPPAMSSLHRPQQACATSVVKAGR